MPLGRKLYRCTHARRRGTAYVLVLGITSLLVTLGLAAIELSSIERERYELAQDQATARYAAFTGLDLLHKSLEGNSTWRDSASDDTWGIVYVEGDLTLSYKFVDEEDGMIAGDYTQPFRLYTRASIGHSNRLYSVVYTPDASNNLTRDLSTFRQETLVD